MLLFPNAKINIGLNILAKRPDGFHDLESVFYPVSVCDGLEILPASGSTSLFTYGLKIAGETRHNLLIKAFDLLKKDFPEKLRETDIRLYKNIPMGAGLGGGSSDAAFLLKMLNRQYGLSLSGAALQTYALQLGSDCPFFIDNRPCFASGRGERMEALEMDLSGFAIQLICPEIHISTAEAFKHIRPRRPAKSVSELRTATIRSWKDWVVNDFEPHVFSLYPALAGIKRQLYRQGALYASLSGSGAALYGIFPKGEKASVKTSLPHREFYL